MGAERIAGHVCIYYLSKSAVPAEFVTVASLIIFADLTKPWNKSFCRRQEDVTTKTYFPRNVFHYSPQNSDVTHCAKRNLSRKSYAGDAWILSVLMDCHGDRSGGGLGKRMREASLRKISFFRGYICRSWNACTMAQRVSEKATCTGTSLPFLAFL